MRKIHAKLLGLACMAAMVVAGPNQSGAADDIVDTAVQAGQFETLATALKAAGLVDALKGDGPFTVFAPTDEAFAKLPAETLQSLLQPGNKDQLVAILTYHVVSGEVPAEKVVKLNGATTLNGQRVDIKAYDGKVMIDKAKVVKTDIQCENGLIHVIDSVVLPSFDDIPTTAEKAGKFSTLLAAAQAAGLVEALQGEGPLTVFAPTDEAFEKLPEGTVATLLEPANRDKLAAILKYHVVAGRVYSDDALKAKSAKTLQGQKLEVSADSGQAKVNEANLVATDIDASNGVIHVIDAVLIPPQNVGARESSRATYRVSAADHGEAGTGHTKTCPQASSAAQANR